MTYSEQVLADQRRVQLHFEINSYPVRIDRKCHCKTSGEIDNLKEAKSNWKLTVPVGYRPKTIAVA